MKNIALYAAKAYACMFVVVLFLSVLFGFDVNTAFGFALFYSVVGIVGLNLMAIDAIGSGAFITALCLYQFSVTFSAIILTVLWFKHRDLKLEVASICFWGLSVVLLPVVMQGLTTI
ncbi:hypothetical protein [Reinekea sp. G2M2-21]|uniref:hypothetical protein n=1 Tax=Reinekea sp. G2M2-21 TaxID=2788942 RepID=UPI0018ABCE81|nr:hypothetical protein [Reinekea sp. G2M2-21]